MAWRAVAYEDSVATLSTNTPAAITGAAAAAGTGTAASKDDHVHALGPLTADLDFDGNGAKSFVFEAVATAPDAAAETVGQAYVDTDDEKLYIWNT